MKITIEQVDNGFIYSEDGPMVTAGIEPAARRVFIEFDRLAEHIERRLRGRVSQRLDGVSPHPFVGALEPRP